MHSDLQISPEMRADFQALADKFEHWMLQTSFPFWAKRSVNPDGGFFERLDLNAQPIIGEDSRVRLQARMAYTFALAAKLGWDREHAEQLADRGVAILIEECRRSDGLYGRRVKPGQGLTDDGAETYDTAFALLAFATVYDVFGSKITLDAGTELSAAIDDLLKRPASEGGYRERLPATALREQNPHMHLTEASLAWFEATGDMAALARAQELAHFVERTFYDSQTGCLIEFAGDGVKENRVEAGHLFEWVWILGRLRDLGGTYPAQFAQELHDNAMRLIQGTGIVPLSQHLDGSERENFQRTWGPTEKLKGHIALWTSEPSKALTEEILATVQLLWDDHVEYAIPGAWIDVITPDREPMIKDITPATGYHIYLAFAEFIHFARALSMSNARG